MRAWHFTGTNEPLVRVEIPEPVPGPGEAVVDISGRQPRAIVRRRARPES